jgi:hypothetical protein
MTLIIPVCAGMLSSVVKESLVVVGCLEGYYFLSYEFVEGGDVSEEVRGKGEGYSAVRWIWWHFWKTLFLYLYTVSVVYKKAPSEIVNSEMMLVGF